jgi:hypothetical protein
VERAVDIWDSVIAIRGGKKGFWDDISKVCSHSCSMTVQTMIYNLQTCEGCLNIERRIGDRQAQRPLKNRQSGSKAELCVSLSQQHKFPNAVASRGFFEIAAWRSSLSKMPLYKAGNIFPSSSFKFHTLFSRNFSKKIKKIIQCFPKSYATRDLTTTTRAPSAHSASLKHTQAKFQHRSLSLTTIQNITRPPAYFSTPQTSRTQAPQQ